MSAKTIIAVRHFGLGGRESLETAVIDFYSEQWSRDGLCIPITYSDKISKVYCIFSYKLTWRTEMAPFLP